MKKTTILLSIAVFLASCASNSGSRNTAKNIEVSRNAKIVLADKSSDERVICKQIRKTGSNRISTVCRSSSEIKAERKATQTELRRHTFKGGTTSESRGL